MSKEIKHRQKPPTIVGRLMGLDSLPISKPVVTVGQSTYDGFSFSTWANKQCQRVEDEHFENSVQYDRLFSHGNVEYRDIYEVQQKPPVLSVFKAQSTAEETYDDHICQKRMSFVQQKFAEAKRMAADENLMQSREFQDAIKFLSSNKDLFLKFLEEPNSQFPERLSKFRNSPHPSQTSQITVLRPIATIQKANEDSANKRTDDSEGSTKRTNRHLPQRKPRTLSEPTKIVILKPSPRYYHEIQPKDPILSGGNVLTQRHTFGSMHSNEAVGCGKLANEIACQIQNESLLSSVSSNGYDRDDSSCNISESEFIEEEYLSDSEMATPTSSHSCDYRNELGSPYSSTTFSKASCSPESSVITEAKKRLAERLAMNVNNQECRGKRTSSGTLGEVLACSEVKKREGLNVSSPKIYYEEQEIRKYSSSLSMGRERTEFASMRSAKDLSRSNSAPILLTDIKATNVDVTYLTNKSVVKEEKSNSNTVKSGFKSKVSSLFFSKSKKMNRDDAASGGSNGRQQNINSEACCDELRASSDVHLEEVELTCNKGKNVATTLCDDETSRAFLRPALEHRSPVSVLEPPITDHLSNSLFQLSESRRLSNPPETLGRSRPIESVARSLLTECSSLERQSFNISSIFSKADEEHENFLFVKSIITSAQLDTRSGTNFARWHSPESPLNPILLDEYVNVKHDEATCILPRSRKRLLFDGINAALLEISDRTTQSVYPWCSACGRARVNSTMFGSLADEVWRKISRWESCDKNTPGKTNDIKLAVDRLVKKEVSEWNSAECVWSEMFEFGKDISGKVLDELVEETLSQLI